MDIVFVVAAANDRLTSPLELEGRPSLARTSMSTTMTMVSSSSSSPSAPGHLPRDCSKHHHCQDQDPYDKHHDDDNVTTAYSTSLEEDGDEEEDEDEGGEEGENNGDDDYDNDDDEASLSRCPSHTTSYHSAAMMTHGEPDVESASSGGDGEPGRFERCPAVVVVLWDDDLLSLLSSSPFSLEEEVDDDVEDDPPWNPRSGASTPSFEGTDRGGAHVNANAHLSELVEHAREMLRREMSDEHRIDDYFLWEEEEEEGGRDRESPSSSWEEEEEEEDACGPHSPIDPSCRLRMMEWSLRILAVSFPHRPPHHHRDHRPPKQRGHKHRRPDSGGGAPPIPPRRHSDQAIQVASQAFALVDRLATRHRRRASQEGGGRGDRGDRNCRDGPIVMGRSEYKRVCMACLHVAAKTCGLFGLYVGEEREYDAHEEEEEYEDNVDGRDLPSSLSSMRASFAAGLEVPVPATPPSPQCEEGQTILPTPSSPYRYDDDPINPTEKTTSVRPGATARRPAGPVASHAGRRRCRRPPLGILSLPGLSALCHGEHSPAHLAKAERDVLEGLGWRAIAGECTTAVDWCGVLLAMLVACPAKVGGDDDGRGGRHRTSGDPLTDDNDDALEEKVRERAMACLERVVEANLVPAPPPLLAAWAAVLRALDATTRLLPSLPLLPSSPPWPMSPPWPSLSPRPPLVNARPLTPLLPSPPLLTMPHPRPSLPPRLLFLC